MDDDFVPKKKMIHISINSKKNKRAKKRNKALNNLKISNKKIDYKKKNNHKISKIWNNNTIGKNNHYNSKKDTNSTVINNQLKKITRETNLKKIDNRFLKGILKPREYIKPEKEKKNELKNDIVPKSQILGDNIKKKKSHKRFYFILVFIILFSIASSVMLNILDKKIKLEEQAFKKREEKAIVARIESHYNKIVKVVNDTSLYSFIDNKYVVQGTIYHDVIVDLDDVQINADTNYFKLSNKELFLDYKDVLPIEEEEEIIDTRYKRYIPFNENIITNDTFTLYNNDKKMYTFDVSMEFPIIIKDYEGKYYVEYDNRLLSINKDEVSKIISAHNTDIKNQSRITTLAYHEIYKPGEKCNDPYVCMKQNNFDMEMKYLKDNNYFTLTMPELYMYLNGNIQINNAIVVTFDDGPMMPNAIEVLEKYDLDGTVFVITGVFFDYSYFASKNLLVQSHGDNLHRAYACRGGKQGGAILCENEESIKNDLKASIEKTGNPPYAFAYPFYDYNDRAIRILKEVGFKMAFVGRLNTMGRAYLGKVDLYKIPRMTVWELSIMSFNTWKTYL